MDRRIHSSLSEHLPTDVDLEAGIRRVRPKHCPQEMLLTSQLKLVVLPVLELLLRDLCIIIRIRFSCKIKVQKLTSFLILSIINSSNYLT